MKKRILSLFLALVTVFYILPIGVIPTIALGESEETGIDITDMEVGKLYSAKWDYTNSDFIPYCPDSDGESMVWKGYPEIYENEAYVLKNDFPQSLIVKRMDADEEAFVYVTNEDWPEEYNDYRYVDVLELTITGEYTPPADDGYIYGKVDINCTDAIEGTVFLEKGEKVHAFTSLDIEVSDSAKYQWQIKVDEDRWATITDYIYPYAAISEALILNAPGGRADIRCIVTDGYNKYASDTLAIEREEDIVSVYAGANGAPSFTQGLKNNVNLAADGDGDSTDTDDGDVSLDSMLFHIQIQYLYRHATSQLDGQNAAPSFGFAIPSGSSYSGTVTSPAVIGYSPYMKYDLKSGDTVDGTTIREYPADSKEYYIAKPAYVFTGEEFKNNNIDELKITIYYLPNEVMYTVKHYEQNPYNDNYSPFKTEIKYGYADDAVGEELYDLSKTASGFTALFYDPTDVITPDGMATIEIYYDRQYYLIDFDLDGGQGVAPYYVRYGTELTIGLPTKLGYTLKNLDTDAASEWLLVEAYLFETDANGNAITDADGNKTKISVNDAATILPYQNPEPTTTLTIKHNLTYKAEWVEATSKYTIIYWLEDADSSYDKNTTSVEEQKKNYDVWYTVNMSATTGATTIAGADNIRTYVTTGRVSAAAESDVAATYPYLTYESALSDTNTKTVLGDGTTAINIYYSRKEYYIKFYYAKQTSGTYYVATETGPASAQNGAVEKVTSWRAVSSLPEIDSASPLYDSRSSEVISGSTYYFFTMNAKYGGNLQEKWPASIVASVYPTNSSTLINFVSWSTQYGSGYHTNNTNKNIKGVYQTMDSNIIVNSNNEQAHFMVGYWNDGARRVVYDVYYEVDSQVTGAVKKGDRYFVYVKSDSLRTAADSANNIDHQTDLKYDGVQEIRTLRELTTNSEPYIYNYYFERISYNIYYNDQYGNTTVLSVPYGTSLDDETYKKTSGPVYPSALEDGERRFIGWFMDASCTVPVDFAGSLSTMPAKNIQIYAGWEDLSYKIKVYIDENQTTLATPNAADGVSFPLTVKFGDKIQEPKYTSTSSYIFAGWYYMENGTEKRFDFNTMTIKKDYLKANGTAIYAKWTSRVPVEYTVYFTLEDKTTNVADPLRGESLELMHKVFYAKTKAELYAEYRTGYFPDVRSISWEMKKDENGVKQNNIYFIYSTESSINYTVKHTFTSDKFTPILGTNTLSISIPFSVSSSDEASVDIPFSAGVKKSVVTAAARAINNSISDSDINKIWDEITTLTPDAFQKNLIIESRDDAVNEVEFVWEELETVGKYQIIFHFQSLDGTSYSFIPQYTIEKMGTFGQTYYVEEAEAPEFMGFKLNSVMSADALNKDLPSNEFTKPTFDAAGNVTGGGLVLELYYDRVTYYYKVVHALYSDDGVEEKPILVGGNELRSALYGNTITVNASEATHANYYLVSDPTYTFVIDSGTSDNPLLITFNYMIYKVSYYYQVLPTDSGYIKDYIYTETVESGHAPTGATPLPKNDGWIFEGWYKDEDLTDPVTSADATIDPSTYAIVPNTPVVDKDNVAFYFYAKFIPTKRVFKNAGSIDATQAVIYRLQGKSTDNNTKNVDITFVITGTGSITLAMLPYGAYTLTVMDWSWRYGDPTVGFNDGTVEGSDGTFDLTLDEVGDVTFTFGAATTDQWLTDDAYGVYQ